MLARDSSFRASTEVLERIEENLTVLSPVSRMIKQGIDAAGMFDKVFARLPAMFFTSRQKYFSNAGVRGTECLQCWQISAKKN